MKTGIFFHTLLLVFILIFVAVVPVSAYNLLTDQTVNVNVNQFQGICTTPSYPMAINIRDVVGFGNVTHIEMTNLHGLKDVNATGHYQTSIYDSTLGNMGNATVDWTWSGLGSWGATGSITIDILDFNRKSSTGYKVFMLYGVPCGGNWYAYHSNTNFPSSAHLTGSYAAGIFGPNNYIVNATYRIYGGPAIDPPIPNANFTASPTYGFLPLQVQFTDTSNQTNSQWSWNYGDGQSSNGSVSNPIHTYSLPGVYTVRMDAYSATYGWYNLTRVNYVTATNPSGVVINLDIKDSISGAILQDVDVGIKNTTTNVWRNATAPTGLVYYDTTDPGYLYSLSVNQTITLAASKTGYKPGSITFAIPYDNYRAYINLVPSSVVNATGTGTLVVSAMMNKNGLPLPRTSITLDTGQMGSTNSAGAYTFQNVTAGTRTATASYSGYQTISQTTTLSAGETKMITMQMILDGQTPVPTYGSPAPTATPGPGDPGYAGVNTSSGAMNERGSTGLMEMMGMVIQLWPLVVIFGFMKFMKAAME